MRRLTLSISEPLAGRQVRTLLRRELGLSAASVRRAKDQPDGILLDARLYQRLCPVGASPLRSRGRCNGQ